MKNLEILGCIAQEHGDVFEESNYQIWVYNQSKEQITHQFTSKFTNLEDVLEDTFQQWKQLYPESNLEDWEDFQDNTDDEEIFIHASKYGIIYQ